MIECEGALTLRVVVAGFLQLVEGAHNDLVLELNFCILRIFCIILVPVDFHQAASQW